MFDTKTSREDSPVFRFFEEISLIPRGSGNEGAISDYLCTFAEKRGLWFHRDQALNVIIKKPASHGNASGPVILQSHMDMVCAKTPGSSHDFEKDPLKLIESGDGLKADGTTLGADDGIGVAMTLAVLDSKDFGHPPIEAVFTSGEETGMDGARMLDSSLLTAKRLINIDMEQEGAFTASCAGGVRADVLIPLEKTAAPTGLGFWEIEILGLTGGHSGMEIHEQRANAMVLMGRILREALKSIPLRLASASGGVRMNVIPSDCRVVIGAEEAHGELLAETVRRAGEALKKEFSGTDPDMTVSCKKTAPCGSVYSEAGLKRLVAALYLLPNGVRSMSRDIAGLVESSCNPGVLEETEQGLMICCAARSSMSSRKEFLKEQIQELGELLGAEVRLHGEYPAWEYMVDSPLRKFMQGVFKDMYGKEVIVSATHAGLECGLLSEKMPGVDMIAVGPDVTGAHTTEETLSISSTLRVWDYLVECLKHM